MKSFFRIIAILVLLPITAFSQSQPDSLADKIDAVYQNLDLSNLIKPYFFQKIRGIFDYRKFQGTNSDSAVTLPVWLGGYYGAEFSCLDCNQAFTPFEDQVQYVNAKMDLGIMPIGVMNIFYHDFKDNALEDSLIYFENGKFYDTPNRIEQPYQSGRFFIASSLSDKFYGRTVKFNLDPSYQILNSEESIYQYEMDFEDGLGFRQVNTSSLYPVTYSSAGEKTVKVKAYTASGILYSQFKFEVIDPATYPTLGLTTNPSYEIPIHGIYGNTSLDNFQTGTGYVFLGCDNVLDKPVILVEGFDNTNEIGWQDILDPNFINFGQTASNLMNYGYDVIILNFKDATLNMEVNAAVLQKLIMQVNNSKVGYHGNVVIGSSMGGLIARLALRRMELAGIDHQAGLFIAFDAPFRGANIPLGLQYLAAWSNEMAYHAPFFLPLLGGVVRLLYNKYLKGEYEALNSPAAKQLLKYHYKGGAEFLNFQAILQQTGYPQECRNIAISSGANDGTGINLGPNWEIFRLDVEVNATKISIVSRTLPSTGTGTVFEANLTMPVAPSSPGCWIWPNSSFLCPKISLPLGRANVNSANYNHQYEHCPGGTWPTQKLIVNGAGIGTTNGNDSHCFVPTVSAFDINTTNLYTNVSNLLASQPSATPFDAVYTPNGVVWVNNEWNSNHRHTFIEGGMSVLLNSIIQNELQPNYLTLQNETETRNHNYEANQTIRAGYSVTNDKPYGNYEITNNAAVVMRAGKSIEFESGFEVLAGSSLHAYIDSYNTNCRQGLDGARIAVYPDKAKAEVSEQPIRQAEPVGKYTTTTVQILYYPNPVSDVFNVDLSKSVDEFSFKFLNLLGREVQPESVEKTGTGYSFSISNFNKGLYVFQCILNGKLQSYKFIKI